MGDAKEEAEASRVARHSCLRLSHGCRAKRLQALKDSDCDRMFANSLAKSSERGKGKILRKEVMRSALQRLIY